MPSCRVLLLLAFVGLALPARATDVPANIAASTRWTAAGNPWRIASDVTVQAGATLTIDPGVEVLVTAQSPTLGLTVLGNLVAQGTTAQPIVFHADPGGRGSWRGLRVSSSTAGSSLKSLQILDAANALVLDGPAAVDASDLVVVTTDTGIRISGGTTSIARPLVSHAWGSAISVEGTASVTITDAVVKSGRGAGIEVGAGAAATVKRARVVANGLGAKVDAGGSLSLESSLIAGNSDGGVLFAQAGGGTIGLLNDTIDRNSADPVARTGGTHGGIHATAIDAPAKVTIRNCLVTNHGTTGIRLDGGFATVDTNDVWNNGTDYQGLTAGANSKSADPLYANALFSSAPATNAAWQPHAIPLAWNAPSGEWHGHWYVELYDAAWMRAQVQSFVGGSGDVLRFGDRAGATVASFTANQTGPSAPASGSYLDVFLDSTNAARFTISAFETLPLTYDFALSTGSPAIDAGSTTGGPADDADGFARPYDGDGTGGSATDLGAFEFHGNIAPIANAGPDQSAARGTQLTLDGSASRDPDGTIRSWDWDFGDGSAHGTTSVVKHAYAANGAYTAILKVTDDHGATASDTATITVSDLAPAGPVAHAGGSYEVNLGDAVAFDGSNSTDDGGTITSYSWAFGDGASGSGAKTTHTYEEPGTWTATLTVTDDHGGTSSDTAEVVVHGAAQNELPVADAGPDMLVNEGDTVTLDGSHSRDPDGHLVAFSWTFGDGESATGPTPTHVFQVLGENRVMLTVTDDLGGVSSDEAVVTVNGKPHVVLTGPHAVAVNQKAEFDGSASADPDGRVVAWKWTFDGRTQSGPKASFAWQTVGDHRVSLEVTDDRGATASTEISVHVSTSVAADGCTCATGGEGALLVFGLLALRRRRRQS